MLKIFFKGIKTKTTHIYRVKTYLSRIGITMMFSLQSFNLHLRMSLVWRKKLGEKFSWMGFMYP